MPRSPSCNDDEIKEASTMTKKTSDKKAVQKDDDDDIDDDQEHMMIMSDDLRDFVTKNKQMVEEEFQEIDAIIRNDHKNNKHSFSNIDGNNLKDESGFTNTSTDADSDVDDQSLHDLWNKLSEADQDLYLSATSTSSVTIEPPINIISPKTSSKMQQDSAIVDSMDKEISGCQNGSSMNSMQYTLYDHYTYLKLFKSSKLGLLRDISDKLESSYLPESVFDFCQPISERLLRSTYYGLCPSTEDTINRKPVRTISIRVRPDVLCGEIMNAIHKAITSDTKDNDTNDLLKRQGGHLQAVLVRDGLSFVYDAQLIIKRMEPNERILLIRIYQPNGEELNGIGKPSNDMLRSNRVIGCQNSLNLDLREACVLANLISATERRLNQEKTGHCWQDSQFPSFGIKTPKSATLFLQSIASQCVSIADKKFQPLLDRFPSLHPKNWELMEVSVKVVEATINSLQDDLVYGCLKGLSLDANATLTELVDFHFSMQLYVMLRFRALQEVTKALQTAEKQIDQASEINAVFANLTRQKMIDYNLKEIEEESEEDPLTDELSDVRSLTAKAIQNSEILSDDNRNMSSRYDLVESAVKVVRGAFLEQLQDTQKERTERLCGHSTNLLAKKERWLSITYNMICDACDTSKKAVNDRANFLALLSDKSTNGYSTSNFPIQSVVLLEFDIDKGTFWISATHVVVAIRSLFQQRKVFVFGLNEIKVRAKNTYGGSLQIISRDGDECHTFRPRNIDACDVAKFILILRLLLRKEKAGMKRS